MDKVVRVYWPSEKEWYEGIIDSIHEKRGYHVQFYDGDEDYIPHEDIHNKNIIQFVRAEDEPFELDLNEMKNNEEEEEEEEEVLILSPNNMEASVVVMDEELSSPKSSPAMERLKSSQQSNLSNHSSPNTRISLSRENNMVDDEVSVRSTSNTIRSTSSTTYYLNSHDVILASGKIHYIQNLPPPLQEDRDGRIFFRVLYAGVSTDDHQQKSQSAVFQCKTLIFESEKVLELSERLQWKNSNFKFEIDKQIDFDENIPAQGDIIFALYRQRSYGGNEFVGQTVLSVSKLCQQGNKAVVRDESILERRSLKGVLNLYDRTNKTVLKGTSMSLEISISWHKSQEEMSAMAVPSFLTQALSSRPGISQDVPKLMSSQMRSNSILSNTKRGILNGEGLESRRSGTAAVLSGRPKSASVVTGPRLPGAAGEGALKPRSLNKAQREFQWKVERENKAMQSRLAKHATKGNDVEKLSVVYGSKVSGAAVVKGGGVSSVESRWKQQQSAVPNARDKRPEVLEKQLAEDAEYVKLVALLQQLKDETAAVSGENVELNSKLNRLRIQSKRWDTSQDRIRKGVQKMTGLASSNHSDKSSSSSHQGALQQSSYLRALEREEVEAADMELNELLKEYRYLQETRRSLKSRASAAVQQLKEHQLGIECNQAKVADFHAFAVGIHSGTGFDEEKISLERRLNTSKIELLRLKSIVDEDLYSNSLQDDIDQYKASIAFFKTKILEEKQALELLEYERDVVRERIHTLREDNVRDGWRLKVQNLRRDIIQKRIECALPPLPTLFTEFV